MPIIVSVGGVSGSVALSATASDVLGLLCASPS
jgi:hypothetical protein